MSCFLKDLCNRLLSHCSVKGCDFFSQYDKPREGKGEGKPFWTLAIIFLDLGFQGLIDLSTSFKKLEYIFILKMVLLGSRLTNPSVELLLCVTLLK